MDHLLLPGELSNFEYPEVPYLFDPSSPFIYDNGASHPEYLLRAGWSWPEVKAIAKGRPSPIQGHTKERAASLIQAWLYFGFIHLITRLPVDTRQYVQQKRSSGDGPADSGSSSSNNNNSNKQIVSSSKPLLKHLAAWREDLASREDGGASQIASVDKLFQAFHYFLNYVAVICSDLLPANVALSIVMLHQTLVLAKLTMFPQSLVPRELCTFYDHVHKRISSSVVESGWCGSVVKRLGHFHSTLTLYHMASIQPMSSPGEHRNCSDKQCRATLPARGAYKPQHAVVACSCELEPSLQDQVTQIVEASCVPLLSYSKDRGISITSIDSLSNGAVVEYVAISHVWVDGLGNPSDNTMHRCQLELIQHRVNAVLQQTTPQERLFWIDTLCVPAQDGEAKSIALAMMGAIYRAASLVLVIDANLVTIDLKTHSLPQIAFAIASSKWWTRLWTLQEGVFATALFFQLATVALSKEDIVRESQRRYSAESAAPPSPWDMQTMLVSNVLSQIQEQLSLSKLRSNSGRQFLHNISWRFCSREEDEAICLAILLDLPVVEIARLPKDPVVRMKAFILMQRAFPTSVLFGNGVVQRHLSEEGFGWASRSFMGRTRGTTSTFTTVDVEWQYEEPTSENVTFADEKGLHVQSFGLQLDLKNCKGKEEGPIQTEAKCMITSGPDQGVYALKIVPDAEGRVKRWQDIYTWIDKSPFLILPRRMDQGTRSLYAVLVSVAKASHTNALLCWEYLR